MSYTGFWNEIRKIPPVTRFLCGSSLAVSLPVMLQLLSPYKVIFVRAFVTEKFEVCFHAQMKRPHSDEAQLWRIWSSFFFGGMWRCVVSRCALDMLRLDCRQRSQLHFRVGHDVVCTFVSLVLFFERQPLPATIRTLSSSDTTLGGLQIMPGS